MTYSSTENAAAVPPSSALTRSGWGLNFNDLSITTKVGTSFSLLLGIIALISVFSWQRFGRAADGFYVYIEHVRTADLARDIDREFLEFRRLIREMLVTSGQADAQNAQHAGEIVVRDTQRALATIGDEKLSAGVRTILGKFLAFNEDFQKLSQLQQHRSALLHDQLDATTEEIRVKLEELQNSGDNLRPLATVEIELLSKFSLNVAKLIANYSTTKVSIADKTFREFRDALPPLEIATRKTPLEPAVRAIDGLLDGYYANYKSAVSDSREIEELFNGKMLITAEEVASDIQRLKNDEISDQLRIAQLTADLMKNAEHFVLLLAAAGLVSGIILAAGLSLRISKPIVAICSAMRELAAGNLNILLPGLGQKDEVGQMAAAVEEFKIRAITSAKREAAEREQTIRSDEASRKAMLLTFSDSFEEAVGGIVKNVSSSAEELGIAANALGSTAEMTQQLAEAALKAFEQATTHIQTVANTTEELRSSIIEIGRQVNESNITVAEAVTEVNNTNALIEDLSRSAQRVGDVIAQIDAISRQTNLLALNATIEAGRAGELGKGFAVVAIEVKLLAGQTASATEHIREQVDAMQAATQHAVSSITTITSVIDAISNIAAAISKSVEQQAVATHEIVRNVQRVTEGTQKIASSFADVNRGATETGSASTQVLYSANSMSLASERLREELALFMSNVRAS